MRSDIIPGGTFPDDTMPDQYTDRAKSARTGI